MNIFQEMVACRMLDLESMNVACRVRRECKLKKSMFTEKTNILIHIGLIYWGGEVVSR